MIDSTPGGRRFQLNLCADSKSMTLILGFKKRLIYRGRDSLGYQLWTPYRWLQALLRVSLVVHKIRIAALMSCARGCDCANPRNSYSFAFNTSVSALYSWLRQFG
jgi:hypothetical protein